MATNEQFIPLTEEQREEKERLQGNSKDFVPIEEVADDALLPDQFEEKEVYVPESSEPDDMEEEAMIKELHDQIIGANKTEKPLYFYQGEGAASVGPDVEENEEAIVPDTEVLEGERDTREDKKSSRQAANPVIVEPDYYLQRSGYRDRRTKENLKTQSDSKKERSVREKLRDLLHFWKTDKKVEALESYDPNEIPDDPIEYKDDKAA